MTHVFLISGGLLAPVICSSLLFSPFSHEGAGVSSRASARSARARDLLFPGVRGTCLLRQRWTCRLLARGDLLPRERRINVSPRSSFLTKAGRGRVIPSERTKCASEGPAFVGSARDLLLCASEGPAFSGSAWDLPFAPALDLPFCRERGDLLPRERGTCFFPNEPRRATRTADPSLARTARSLGMTSRAALRQTK